MGMRLLTGVGQTECPEPQVGGCVGDGSQTVLDGVDSLMDEYLPKLKLWCVCVCVCVCGKRE